jgi:hypothetical protein
MASSGFGDDVKVKISILWKHFETEVEHMQEKINKIWEFADTCFDLTAFVLYATDDPILCILFAFIHFRGREKLLQNAS